MEQVIEAHTRLLVGQADSIAGMHIFLSCLADELSSRDPELISALAARIRVHDNLERDPERQVSAIRYALALAGRT
jgi:hypothetical protein